MYAPAMKSIVRWTITICLPTLLGACDAPDAEELELRMYAPGPAEPFMELELEDGPAEVDPEVEVLTPYACKGTVEQVAAACSAGSPVACQGGSNGTNCSLVICHGEDLYFCMGDVLGSSCHFDGAPAQDCEPM